ncbi:MAG: hypothetical protein DRQ59_00700 [Gammaproteobacteria bacterium]|nr:MAG: hypothetical protein DRQ59_00700 [Gammaproteobacteria bacterium]
MQPDSDDKPDKATRPSQLAALGAVLAFIACNGLFILIAVFAALGITLVINPHVQAAAISLLALITLAMVFIAFRKNKIRGPLILSAIGALIVIGTMYIHYDKIIESVGLLALFVSAIWSWRASS